MPRYRLHVDETVNRINYVDIETDLNNRELDALLTKIEKDEIIGALSLKRKLEAQGIVVKGINLSSKPYYLESKTVEIEQLEEPQNQEFIIKVCDLSKENIEQAIEFAREAMIASIEQNGLASAKTINLSQELDILIVTEMKGRQLERR